MAIKLAQRTLAFLAHAAEREYPRESCAILLGRSCDEVNAAVHCANVHPEPLRHYALDPRDLIRVQRTARSFGLQIVGFHHSHPDHEAVPSQIDLDEADWPGLYLITSVRKTRAATQRGFSLCESEGSKSFRETSIDAQGTAPCR